MNGPIEEKGLVAAVRNKIFLLHGETSKEIACCDNIIRSLVYHGGGVYYGGDFHGISVLKNGDHGPFKNDYAGWTEKLFSDGQNLYQGETQHTNNMAIPFGEYGSGEKYGASVFCLHDNELYAADHETVRKAFGEERQDEPRRLPGKIYDMISYHGHLYAVGEFRGVYDVLAGEEVTYLYEFRRSAVTGTSFAVHDSELYHIHGAERADRKGVFTGPRYFQSILAKSLDQYPEAAARPKLSVNDMVSFGGRLFAAGSCLDDDGSWRGRIIDILNDPDGEKPLFRFPYRLRQMIKIPEKIWDELWQRPDCGGKSVPICPC